MSTFTDVTTASLGGSTYSIETTVDVSKTGNYLVDYTPSSVAPQQTTDRSTINAVGAFFARANTSEELVITQDTPSETTSRVTIALYQYTNGQLELRDSASVVNPASVDTDTGTNTTVTESVTPKLIGPQNTLEPITMKVRTGIGWNNDVVTTDSGIDITNNNGSNPPRVSIEGVLTVSQLDTLRQMRNNTNEVEITSNSYTGIANFDTLKLDEDADDQRINATVNGRNVTEPMVSFQLQTKARGDEEQTNAATNSLF